MFTSIENQELSGKLKFMPGFPMLYDNMRFFLESKLVQQSL
jgi:hypothetical protein